MLQPIMPLIEYNMNKEYIVSVLCENRNKPELGCNGKCYLDKKIKSSKSHDSHDHSIPQIDLSKYPVSLLDYSTCKIEEFKLFDSEQLSVVEFTSQDFHTSLLKPPQSES